MCRGSVDRGSMMRWLGLGRNLPPWAGNVNIGLGQLELLTESLLSGWAACVKSALCLGKGGIRLEEGNLFSVLPGSWLWSQKLCQAACPEDQRRRPVKCERRPSSTLAP